MRRNLLVPTILALTLLSGAGMTRVVAAAGNPVVVPLSWGEVTIAVPHGIVIRKTFHSSETIGYLFLNKSGRKILSVDFLQQQALFGGFVVRKGTALPTRSFLLNGMPAQRTTTEPLVQIAVRLPKQCPGSYVLLQFQRGDEEGRRIAETLKLRPWACR